jgi:hypothetical protein
MTTATLTPMDLFGHRGLIIARIEGLTQASIEDNIGIF